MTEEPGKFLFSLVQYARPLAERPGDRHVSRVLEPNKAAPAKQRRAIELVAEHRRARTAVLSLQVLQEYFVTVRRKRHVDAKVARRKVELLAEFDLVASDLDDILAATDLHRLHSFSFWDAVCFELPKRRHVFVLFSEDLRSDRIIEGIQIVNPFV